MIEIASEERKRGYRTSSFTMESNTSSSSSPGNGDYKRTERVKFYGEQRELNSVYGRLHRTERVKSCVRKRTERVKEDYREQIRLNSVQGRLERAMFCVRKTTKNREG